MILTPLIVSTAYSLAQKIHGFQVDKIGIPYLGHLVRVFDTVRGAGGDHDQVCEGSGISGVNPAGL